MDTTRLWSTALLALALPFCAQASPYDNVAPLFADDAVLDVTIEAPLEALMDVRPDKAYLDGSFTYTEADGTVRKLGLKLRTRGNYRRDNEHCDFAPIRLNLDKSQLDGTLFDGQDKLKLVTHCRSNEPKFEQYVLREYLAYRMFHELTPQSFAVRLLRITYINTGDGKSKTKLGFVIETDGDMARRNGMKPAKVGLITREYLEPVQESLVHVYQYMIGNTEYSVLRPEPDKNCCHNADLMAPKGETVYTAVPFDFDFAGFVNAPYAQPNPRYKLPNVRVRLFLGHCEYDEQLQSTVQFFHDRKDDIYRIFEGQELMSRTSASSTKKYVDTFYERIAGPADVQKWLINKCYKPK